MINFLCFLFLIVGAQQETVPYKASDEYEVNIDYKFQDRPPSDRNKLNNDGSVSNKQRSIGKLPYLKLRIKLLKLGGEESKINVVNSNGNLIYNRKASLDTELKLDIGFIDDVKDRVQPHEFTVLFLSDSKKAISKIHLIIMEDGTFMVNNEMKGKF